MNNAGQYRWVRDIVGRSAAIGDIIDPVGQVARSHCPVLIEGESGTGKGTRFRDEVGDVSFGMQAQARREGSDVARPGAGPGRGRDMGHPAGNGAHEQQYQEGRPSAPKSCTWAWISSFVLKTRLLLGSISEQQWEFALGVRYALPRIARNQLLLIFGMCCVNRQSLGNIHT